MKLSDPPDSHGRSRTSRAVLRSSRLTGAGMRDVSWRAPGQVNEWTLSLPEELINGVREELERKRRSEGERAWCDRRSAW